MESMQHDQQSADRAGPGAVTDEAARLAGPDGGFPERRQEPRASPRR
ncbi:MAG: hypothetical protein GXX90_07515 [Microbacteriaceae bacterium]|nr:hypothetical protein [Microbacteriaceae bacterium]